MEVILRAPIVKPLGYTFHLTLASTKIPFSWYSISAHLKNNELEYDTTPDAIKLEAGNYTVYELVEAINDAEPPFILSYNHITNKITIQNYDTLDHIIKFASDASAGLAKVLGFEQANTTIKASASIVSGGVVMLHTVHSIFLHSSLAIGNVLTTEANNYEQILDKITMHDARPNEMISHHPYLKGPFHAELTQDVISSFWLALRDQNGRLLQLNGVNYELSLSLNVVKDSDNTTNMGMDTQLGSVRGNIEFAEIKARKRVRLLTGYSEFEDSEDDLAAAMTTAGVL